MSFTPAIPISSPQTDIHEHLEKTVLRHLTHAHKKPVAQHNQQAFEKAYQYWQTVKLPIILDSGCGTGESSRFLAQQFPDHLVIGIDRSAKRLGHSANTTLPDNCLLLRCECGDFWTLARQRQWQFTLHTLFYPNPYPKRRHLQRRWHGHAAVSDLLAVSQQLLLRTNWEVYAKEFYAMLALAQQHRYWHHSATIARYTPTHTITAFERKYQHSQHGLWQVLSLADNHQNPL